MKNELITFEDPKSPVSEMFRTLRTNIQFMNTDEAVGTILITSTLPGEGKSWIASNLSVTFAQAGKKVILIDADMRKGRQYNIFTISPRPGLSNYLSGVINGEKVKKDADIEMFIKNTKVDNLYVMPAGNVPPNPSELLVSQKMDKLIKGLKDRFDVIIFDGTPSLLVADAIILSRLVDTTLIVSAHKETKLDNLDKVKKTIENVGGNIAGVILNKIPISGKKYEDRYYYGSSSKKEFDIQNIDQIEKISKKNDILKKEVQNNIQDKNDEQKIEKEPENKFKEERIPKTTRNKKLEETVIKRTIKNIEIEDEEPKEDRSKDILAQINKYLDKN